MRCASAILGDSDNAATPLAASKARRFKKSSSGVARRSGISHPRRRMTGMLVLRIGAHSIRPPPITAKSRLWQARVIAYAAIKRASWPPPYAGGDSAGLRLRRRRLSRRHDLLGGAAHEFGHVIELEGEAADAGGGRAHLHDEIADLRLGHLHAHHVPAVPTLAGVEAEDLTAPSRHERVHLGGRLRRADDLDLIDRLEQHRLALRQSLVDGEPTSELKRHVGGIDGVIGAVVYLRCYVDHREAEGPVLERVDDARLHRRNVIARHHAALDLLGEAEARPARQRFDVEHDVAVLAVAARLLLMATALHDALLDGLAIADR